MMVVLLLLVAFVCMGLSHGSHEEKYYGDTIYIRLLRKPDFVEFSPNDNSNVTILWKQGDRSVTLDKKFKMTASYFRISHLTQKDSGRYTMRDKDLKEISNYTLEVKATALIYYRKTGDHFTFNYGLEPNSCNIYFFPESDRQPRKLKNTIVHQGKLQGGLNGSGCTGFDLLGPCGISKKVLQMSCSGRYEIRDQNDNTAFVVSMKMSPLPYEPSHIGIGIGAFLVSLFCSCVKCCCCGKSKSEENGSETAAAEPDVQYQEYDTEPVGPRSGQLIDPSGTHDTDQPSSTVTDPLVRDHPFVDLPPSYSEVSAPAEQPDAPTVPVHSDPEPTFEFKGMTVTSAPPLGSESTNSDVYTSDKLNFL
ncbi:uncharacterized protein LOC116378438 isoform X1 [Anarrhichthys ocellatus]|uniref:uncharacterized protein LOC116378438 isoform X1 n=1 Tax=Anarrhichthys ocellatus TaxID=433405 RepID=UPI0012ED6D1D|nr:uncharacterized protein LOC116378438 isoform X1 [Anarrhichthys ocellatus]